MPKKKTFEEVEAAFKSRNFQLLSTEYIGVHSHLEYICDKGHQTKICLANLQKGIGCSSCSGLKKKTIKEVRELFTARGFTLVSTEYKNVMSPLDYLCSNNHRTKISFSHLQRGIGCSSCAGLKKKTLEEVRELFTARGFKLLTTVYKGALLPLKYVCDKGHQTKIRFSSLRGGNGCAECSGKKKKTIEEVRELFTARNYTLLSIEYKGNKSPLKYICSNGHRTKISFDSFQSGRGCSSCAKKGFDSNKPAILYYLRFQYEGNFYYKIGITNNTTSKRFQSEKTSYTILKETFYNMGKDAHTQEQTILKKFSAYRYKGHSFLTMRGDTELFIKDILQLDDSILKAGRM